VNILKPTNFRDVTRRIFALGENNSVSAVKPAENRCPPDSGIKMVRVTHSQKKPIPNELTPMFP